MAEKAKAEGNNFVKKLLSSNLTWSIVAFILLVIICTIFQIGRASCRARV